VSIKNPNADSLTSVPVSPDRQQGDAHVSAPAPPPAHKRGRASFSGGDELLLLSKAPVLPVSPTVGLRIDCDGTLQQMMSDGSWEPVPRVDHEWGEPTEYGYKFCSKCGAAGSPW